MSNTNSSDSSTSESEVSVCSPNFNALKALYSKKTKLPVENVPLYENIQQFEAAQSKRGEILPVGSGVQVRKREEDKEQAKIEKQKEIEQINKQRFSKFNLTAAAPLPRRAPRNVLTRLAAARGPLAALRDCVDQRIRIKVVTRHERGVRGWLLGTLVAFDKQWNLALQDVLEVWTRRPADKRKIPPAMGTPVPAGSAAALSAVPAVSEAAAAGGARQCSRHVPQLLVRGEHVVLVNVVER